MKTNKPAAVALVLWFLFVASQAFAVLKPPYPVNALPPDHVRVIVISDEPGDDEQYADTKCRHSAETGSGIEREKISQSQDKPKNGGSKTAVPGK